MADLLSRNSRIEEDLIDQLFNSSEKRLARTLLLLGFGGMALLAVLVFLPPVLTLILLLLFGLLVLGVCIQVWWEQRRIARAIAKQNRDETQEAVEQYLANCEAIDRGF
jgi:hypothetical protein